MLNCDKRISFVANIAETADLLQKTFISTCFNSDDPLDILVQRELAQRIDETLGKLSKRDRELILYRHEYDMTITEVADEIGINAPNARSAVSRARKRFCKWWKEGDRSNDK